MAGKPAVVIDNGSGFIKAGVSGQDTPKVRFPSVVGYPVENDPDCDCYIGTEAMQKRSQLNLVWPIEGGVVKDWENMNKLWRHTVNDELRMAVGGDPEDIDCHGEQANSPLSAHTISPSISGIAELLVRQECF